MAGSVAALPAGEAAADADAEGAGEVAADAPAEAGLEEAGEAAADAPAEAGLEEAGEAAADAPAEAGLEEAGEAAADAIDGAALGAAFEGPDAAGVPLQALTASNAAIAKETDFGNRMREPPGVIRLRTAIAGMEWL